MAGDANDERTLLDDRIRYYRARAAEHDATSPPDDLGGVHLDGIRRRPRFGLEEETSSRWKSFAFTSSARVPMHVDEGG